MLALFGRQHRRLKAQLCVWPAVGVKRRNRLIVVLARERIEATRLEAFSRLKSLCIVRLGSSAQFLVSINSSSWFFERSRVARALRQSLLEWIVGISCRLESIGVRNIAA